MPPRPSASVANKIQILYSMQRRQTSSDFNVVQLYSQIKNSSRINWKGNNISELFYNNVLCPALDKILNSHNISETNQSWAATIKTEIESTIPQSFPPSTSTNPQILTENTPRGPCAKCNSVDLTEYKSGGVFIDCTTSGCKSRYHKRCLHTGNDLHNIKNANTKNKMRFLLGTIFFCGGIFIFILFFFGGGVF